LNIGTIGGIYKKYDFDKPVPSKLPLDQNDRISIYHIRSRDLELFWSLKAGDVDIMVTHDWPTNFYNFGDNSNLLYSQVHKSNDFKQDMKSNKIGCPFFWKLMCHLKPKYWLCAHHHASINYKIDWPDSPKSTQVITTNKVLRDKKFVTEMEIDSSEGENCKISFNEKWVNLLRQNYVVNSSKRIFSGSLVVPNKDIKDLGNHKKCIQEAIFGVLREE
ncbi:MAG: lariat debranching enzyme, partial [Paramarteilia canceri]